MAAKKRGRPKLTAAQKRKRAESKKVINRRSQVTGKPPTKRLKRRRAENKAPGYFPNPSRTGYVLEIKPSLSALKKGVKDEKGFWTGNGWDTDPSNAVIFPTVEVMKKAFDKIPAKLLGGSNYTVGGTSVRVSVRSKTKGGTKRNPVPPSKYKKVKEAIELFKEFTGHEPEHIDYLPLDTNDVSLKIGECDGILYTTVRDGKKESYIHKFRKKSRPLLAASHDGKKLYILSGEYEFTSRGIVDR